MKRLHIKFIKWLSNGFGYKIVMLKAKNGTTTIEGDREDAYRELFKNSLGRGEYNNSGKLRMNKDLMNSRYEYFKDMPNTKWYKMFSIAPNTKWYKMFSIAKSFIKLIGYTIIPIDLVLGIIILIISETIELIRKLWKTKNGQEKKRNKIKTNYLTN
jgi:hypothetical protein